VLVGVLLVDGVVTALGDVLVVGTGEVLDGLGLVDVLVVAEGLGEVGL
jgi:hypothetical protein